MASYEGVDITGLQVEHDEADECTDDFFKIVDKTERERGDVEISLPFCRLSIDVLLRYLIGARTNVQVVSEETEYFVKFVRAALARSPYSWVLIFNAIPIWDSMKKLIFFVRECFHVQPQTRVHKYIAELVRLRRAKGWTGNEDLVQLLFNAEEKYGAEVKPSGTRHSTDSGHSTNSNTPCRGITPFATVANAELFVIAG
ncbi:hypothetical protein IscW_ISCW011215 [Ixodes scapularis]|uniref:Uncharacterized protein n=1 Tax=Ixodes scapularis TaxID=6945 RepID=B7Q8T0_IXOSC|nr:hypothetical protein IscW_ISCW011215 [Ixodes scapularis]|eukprot:XP_002412428.1 hypothetical protein IscW_ISCW011215 [Ixodes scapularis]